VAQPFEIREARPADRGALGRLWTELVEHHRRLDPAYRVPSPLVPALLSEIDRGLRLDRCHILIASRGERPAGFAFAEVERAAHSDGLARAIGWIHELWVQPELRGCGIGTALVERASEHLRRRGSERIAVRVEAANAEGLRFWQRRGFRDRARVLEQVDHTP
jgi:GNAT superfamily N-acetyltransferase